MKQKDLINRITGQIEEFTILKDVEAEYPFGWDMSRDHIKGEQKAPLLKRKRPYDPLKDARVSDLFRPCGEPPKIRRFLMGRIALCIVAGLCAYDLNEPSEGEMDALLSAAGTTAKEMNTFAGALTDRTFSCFLPESNLPVGVLLYKVLWDALCENCGITGWNTGEEGKKQYVGKEDTAARRRLAVVAEYLRKESLLVFAGEEEASGQWKQEALSAYEDFFARYTMSNCKRKIAVSELKDVRIRKDKERSQLLQQNKKVMTRELGRGRRENVRKPLSAPQLAALSAPVSEAFARSGSPAKIGNHKETEELFSAGIAGRLLQLMDGKNVEEAAHLLAVECSIHPLPAALQESMSRVERNLIALEDYAEAVQEKCIEAVNQSAAGEAAAMCDEDGLAVAEGAFLAILDGDEVSRLSVCRFVFPALGQLFSVPGFGCEVPELEDREEWDEEILPGDNEGLVLPVIRDNEVFTCKPKKSGPGEEMLYPVKLNSAIGEYAGCRFDEEIYVRKSLIKAFQEMGLSQRKARECAIVETVVKLMWDRREVSGKNYFGEGPSEAEKNAAGEAAAGLEKVSARLDEALRAKKNGERENQRLRHEIAELNKKLNRLQEEIGKRDELIELYEKMNEEAEAQESQTTLAEGISGEKSISMERNISREKSISMERGISGEKNVSMERSVFGEKGASREKSVLGGNCVSGEDDVMFPFYTEKKVVLYGGFHSFHQDIEKLLPGIRIIPYASHLDLAPFRNADVIFLQINKTNHSNYWNVCDTARTMGIPFYHLNYANPGRCAVEMVKKIKEIERGN